MADWSWLGNVGKWLGTAAETAKKYQPLIKTGVAALSTYASFKDQQKKNEMQQGVYDDYMRAAADAGHEAQAAVDVNLTPMTVSGTPTTKADVTDFTAVAARGGLMSIPNKQRKRYYGGTDEEEVMEMDEEVISPFDLQQETGLDLTGEQVKYNTANPREGAWSVWNSGGIDQELYEFDFEIFFDSGDWSDHLRGQVDVEENMQMASADPMLQDEYDKYVFELQEIQPDATPMSIEDFRAQAVAGQANGGIIGLRHGGRPGYATRGFVEEEYVDTGDTTTGIMRAPQDLYQTNRRTGGDEEVFMTEEQASTGNPGNAEMYAEDIYEFKTKPILDKLEYIRSLSPEAQEALADEVESLMLELQNIENPPEFKTGGVAGLRKGYRFGPGPVMDQETMAESITLPDGGEEVVTDSMTEIEGQEAGLLNKMIDKHGYGGAMTMWQQFKHDRADGTIPLDMGFEDYANEYGDMFGGADGGTAMAQGGRIRKAPGGIMNLGGLEKDYRTTGGFVPIGAYEKKDDVPARLSKNEFVMTADAVRAAGGGSINKGAQRMYDTMKHLEASPQSKRMTA